jgi:hypothetical protein
MIGDSLAVGTEPFLPGLLGGWSVTTDALKSRPLNAGMARLAAVQGSVTVLAFSLFTNDGPGNLAALEVAVRRSLARQGGDGCVVWATIVRPPYNGVSYAAANRLLAALAREHPGRLMLADWAAAVEAHPEWLAGDGVHATPAGYAGRARLYARAARSCGD